MGKGYSVLVWDGYGAGLVMLNARLLVEGVDLYGNPCNWWPAFHDATESEIENEAIKARNLPWLDRDHPPPTPGAGEGEEHWLGSAYGSRDFQHWKVIVS